MAQHDTRDGSRTASSVLFAGAIGGLAGATLAGRRGVRAGLLGAALGAAGLGASEAVARARQRPGEIPALWQRIAKQAGSDPAAAGQRGAGQPADGAGEEHRARRAAPVPGVVRVHGPKRTGPVGPAGQARAGWGIGRGPCRAARSPGARCRTISSAVMLANGSRRRT